MWKRRVSIGLESFVAVHPEHKESIWLVDRSKRTAQLRRRETRIVLSVCDGILHFGEDASRDPYSLISQENSTFSYVSFAP